MRLMPNQSERWRWVIIVYMLIAAIVMIVAATLSEPMRMPFTRSHQISGVMVLVLSVMSVPLGAFAILAKIAGEVDSHIGVAIYVGLNLYVNGWIAGRVFNRFKPSVPSTPTAGADHGASART